MFLVLLSGCSEEPNNQEENEASLEEGTVITPDEEEEEQNENADNEDENNGTNSSEEQYDTDPLPANLEELAALSQGEYAREIYNNKDGIVLEGKELLEELGDAIPEISSNPSEAEMDYFFREALKLVQDDYMDKEAILKELKFQLLGTPEVEDPRYQFKEQLNISVLLDASGSMAQPVNGTPKMDAAKEAITSFIEELPEETNVALRVYGHEGTGADSDKELSCSSSDILYGFAPYEEGAFGEALNQVQPAGWTPNGLALSKAQEDLADFNGEENTNIVYLVSDGIETCETEPVKVAQEFHGSNIQPIINVIGFDVDSEGQNHLKDIANAAEGLYQTVKDQNELAEEFNKINELAEAWEKWKEQGSQNIEMQESQNKVDIFVYSSQNRTKLNEEEASLKYILEALLSEEQISEETFDSLRERNSEYHDEMKNEVDKLKEELESWNESSYKEALEELEEEYQENQTTN